MHKKKGAKGKADPHGTDLRGFLRFNNGQILEKRKAEALAASAPAGNQESAEKRAKTEPVDGKRGQVLAKGKQSKLTSLPPSRV